MEPLIVALGTLAAVPWVFLIYLFYRLRRRRKSFRNKPKDQAVQEIMAMLADVDGPARVGYLEFRRINPDTLFKRSPGR